jgi:hypothetical protein
LCAVLSSVVLCRNSGTEAAIEAALVEPVLAIMAASSNQA